MKFYNLADKSPYEKRNAQMQKYLLPTQLNKYYKQVKHHCDHPQRVSKQQKYWSINQMCTLFGSIVQ